MLSTTFQTTRYLRHLGLVYTVGTSKSPPGKPLGARRPISRQEHYKTIRESLSMRQQPCIAVAGSLLGVDAAAEATSGESAVMLSSRK